MKKGKKVLAIILLIALLLTAASPILGQEEGAIPTPPAEPTAPPAEPTSPPVPEAPTLEEVQAETATPTPTPAPADSAEPTPVEPTPTPTVIPAATGESTIVTADATNSVSLTTLANTALTDTASATESGSVQENQASVVNTLEQSTVTGQNSASENVGDSSVQTGDANTSAIVVTAVNTNIEGVAVAEFNLADDQKGDLVLDFNNSFTTGASEAENQESFQNNEAVLENSLNLSSDTGNNKTSSNTQGDSTIISGDANVSATVLSFLNNNLEGEVVFGVVNIFGSLTGDIILPQETLPAAKVVEETATQTTQTNSADIENNLSLTATTGDNEASRNTGGDSQIKTGDAQVEAKTVNVANNNISEGNWLIVIINEAGEWIGKILGPPAAASEGAEITQTQASSQTNSQTNSAKIVNNLTLTANTGNNQANDNTGGDSVIMTGEAKTMASLVNFVNNNIASGSKVIVTIINVFGTWLGDFLPPGVKKDPLPPPPPPDPAETEPGTGGSEPAEPEIVTAQVSSGISPTPTSSPAARRVSLSLKKNEMAAPGEVMAAEETSQPRQIRVNLAWLVLAIPILFLTVLLRKLLF